MGKKVPDARLVAAMAVHGVTRVLTDNVRDFTRYAEIAAFAPDDITRLQAESIAIAPMSHGSSSQGWRRLRK